MTDSSPITPAKLNAKKQKDDKDLYKFRLTDAAFQASRYPDPLVPRPSPDPKYKTPPGITKDMTERWLGMMREAREETALQ